MRISVLALCALSTLFTYSMIAQASGFSKIEGANLICEKPGNKFAFALPETDASGKAISKGKAWLSDMGESDGLELESVTFSKEGQNWLVTGTVDFVEEQTFTMKIEGNPGKLTVTAGNETIVSDVPCKAQ